MTIDVLTQTQSADPADSELGFTLTFLSMTKAAARVATAVDGSLLITAPARVFRIRPLELLAGHCLAAIAAGSSLRQEELSLHVGIQIDSQRFCRAVAAVHSEIRIDPALAQTAINRLLARLKYHDSTSRELLDEDRTTLPDAAHREIEASQDAILTRLGGTTICCPSAILIGSKQIAEFSGSFAAKPDRSQLEPQVVELHGRCDGFRIKKRLVFFEAAGESFQAYWEDDRALIEVMELASNPAALHSLRLSKSLDQAGRPIFTFLSAEVAR